MNESHISSQRLNLNPNPIHDQYTKSQEGFFTGLLIGIGIFFGYILFIATCDTVATKAKINKAYNSLSDEEKRKLKDTLQKIYQEMKLVYDKESIYQFNKFKSSISKYKKYTDINSAKLFSNFENSLNKTLKNIEDGNINQLNRINIKYRSFNVDFDCSADKLVPDDYIFDDDIEDKLDSEMNATNIDEKEKRIKVNIGNSLIFKNYAEKYTLYEHSLKKFIYSTTIDFIVDNAKFKKELGFFFDKLDKK